MARIAKKYAEAIKKVDREKRYDMDEALNLLPQMTFAKFDETVELALRLGVDPRHADQMVRGSVALPNGLGKKVRVLVFAKGQKEKEAEEAGAEFIGAEEMIEKIQMETAEAVSRMQQGSSRVKDGVELAQQAGSSMADIRNGAEQVLHSVNEISSALGEQSSASTLIARQVENISQMADRNSAEVDDIASTSKRLAELARSLQDAVDQFKV